MSTILARITTFTKIFTRFDKDKDKDNLNAEFAQFTAV